MAKADRIAWRGLPQAMRLLVSMLDDVQASPALRVQCAEYLIDRCLGKATVQVVADITAKTLVITPAELAAEIDRLAQSLTVSQAQDTVTEPGELAPLDTVNTPE